jgi:glutathione S-transferase
MITIYVFGNVPAPVIGVTRDLRALWAAEEAGVPYRVKPLDFARGELKKPDYLRVNPFGHVPAIEDNGFRLFESAAIIFYLADKSGRLLPKDPKGRALAMQWAFAAVNTVEGGMGELYSAEVFNPDAAWSKERRGDLREQIRRHLDALNRELGERPYLLGEEFSAPDILMSTVLRIVDFTRMIEDYEHIAAYKARCEDRPAWKKIFGEYCQRLAA